MEHLKNTTRPASILRVMASQAALDAWRQNRSAILASIQAIEERPYNWDSEGGLPLREDVARELRHRVLGTYGMDLRNLPRPNLELYGDGTLEMSFSVGKRTVILSFLCDRTVTYWKSNDSGSLIDGIIHLVYGAPATGFAAEIDEVTDWLLEDQSEDWRYHKGV